MSQRLLELSFCPVDILRHYQRSWFIFIQMSWTCINIYVFDHGLSETIVRKQLLVLFSKIRVDLRKNWDCCEVLESLGTLLDQVGRWSHIHFIVREALIQGDPNLTRASSLNFLGLCSFSLTLVHALPSSYDAHGDVVIIGSILLFGAL